MVCLCVHTLCARCCVCVHILCAHRCVCVTCFMLVALHLCAHCLWFSVCVYARCSLYVHACTDTLLIACSQPTLAFSWKCQRWFLYPKADWSSRRLVCLFCFLEETLPWKHQFHMLPSRQPFSNHNHPCEIQRLWEAQCSTLVEGNEVAEPALAHKHAAEG